MAFIVHCGRCRLPPSRCRILFTKWCQATTHVDVAENGHALVLLRSLTAERLASVGLEDSTYARGWLECGQRGTSMALSLQMLEWTTLLPALPPQTWQAMTNDPCAIGLPDRLTHRVVKGSTLARWLGAFTGQRMDSPPDAHLGRWVPGRTALRLFSYLRPIGTNMHHDAIRKILQDLTPDDWLLINAIC